ncbi:MAG: hypothetical protein A2Y15_07800 [Clostridiales bacterium GWF2_36_10]|nr:MAG: hypothetical protein A2Y15_07800 [Clostridiales bacterium GWF2_36_10]
MKRILKTIICGVLMLALTFSVSTPVIAQEESEYPLATAESMGSSGISPITGTFIQPWLYASWNETRWDQEIEEWKMLGIEYLIMGDTLSVSPNNNYTITASYPTNIEEVTRSTDYLTMLFRKCKQYGIKLYIGIGNTDNGWDFLDLEVSASVEKFKKLSTIFAAVAEDIYNIYYEDYKDIFAGFYFVPELYNNSAFSTAEGRSTYSEGLAAGLDIIFDKLNSLNKDLPFIFSPYVNLFGGSWVCKDTEQIGMFWQEALATAGFRDGDILCPQDSVGAGGNDLANLDAMTKAYRNAVDNCGKDIKLYSNCEIFVQPNSEYISRNDEGVNYWETATIDRMIKQFDIVSQYVDKLFVFAYPHYLSSYLSANGFYNTYIHYLETGELDTMPPIAPNTFSTSKRNANGKEALYINWGGMYDNYGISRVNIYKDGKFYGYRIAERGNAKSNTINLYPTKFYDTGYNFNTDKNVTYEFEVIDCSGNVSERSSLIVEPGSVPNNIKLTNIYKGPVENYGDESSHSASSEEDSSEPVSNSDESTGEKIGLSQGVKIALVAGLLAVICIAVFFIPNKNNIKKTNDKK